ncbi:hypothetical protein FD755_005033, partial [Muntiacus reevesi]
LKIKPETHEVLPKPSIWADPGILVAQGSPVTIWCQGSLLVDVYRLYKESGSGSWQAQAPQGSRNKAGFHFGSLSSSDAGQYQCAYRSRNHTFHLSKEGSLAPPQHLRLQDTAPPVRANFTLRAVTSAHGGTYRCYSSQSTAPHLLSLPSDPLELLVSDVSGAPGLAWYLSVLIGVSVTFVLLLLVLLFLRHRGQDRHRKSGE